MHPSDARKIDYVYVVKAMGCEARGAIGSGTTMSSKLSSRMPGQNWGEGSIGFCQVSNFVGMHCKYSTMPWFPHCKMEDMASNIRVSDPVVHEIFRIQLKFEGIGNGLDQITFTVAVAAVGIIELEAMRRVANSI